MRAAVLPILVIVLVLYAAPPELAGLVSVVEVAAERLLDGDLVGAAHALAALDSL
jgi:hypothetical protein